MTFTPDPEIKPERFVVFGGVQPFVGYTVQLFLTDETVGLLGFALQKESVFWQLMTEESVRDGWDEEDLPFPAYQARDYTSLVKSLADGLRVGGRTDLVEHMLWDDTRVPPDVEGRRTTSLVEHMTPTDRVFVLQVYASGAQKAMEVRGGRGDEFFPVFVKDLLHLIERYIAVDGVSYNDLVAHLRRMEVSPEIDGATRDFMSICLLMLAEKS